MEEDSLSAFTLAVTALVGASMVIVTVFLVFLLGFGRQTSYEEAVRARQTHAEKELRKKADKEKEQQRQKRDKKKTGRGRRSEAGRQDGGGASGSEVEVSSTPLHQPPPQQQQPPQKSILKSNNVSTDVKATSSTTRVDFEVSETPARPQKTFHHNPPTPHPSALRISHHPLARSLEAEVAEEDENEESDDGAIPKVTKIKKNQRDDDQPRSKPPKSQAPPSSSSSASIGATKTTSSTLGATASAGKSGSSGAAPSRPQKKSKKKPATTTEFGAEAMPASRIIDIVSTSLLSDDDIQQLMDKLREMMDANADWKGADEGTESVKSLKKTNEKLQKRCEEAETTVDKHYQQIKKLSGDIKKEQVRRQTLETSLQSQISKQVSEITVFKTKISSLEDELKQTKQQSTPQTLKKLEEEKSSLTIQLNTMSQDNLTLKSQLAARSQSLQDAQEQTNRLHSELRRAKSAAKSPTGGAEGRGQLERVSELEGRLRQVEEENTSLQAALTGVRKEKDQLMERVQGLAATSQERDTLTQQLTAAQHQLQETQVAMKTMEEKVAEEATTVNTEMSHLKQHNAQLLIQVETLKKESTGATVTIEAQLHQLRDEKAQLEVRQLEVERSSIAEVQGLRDTNSQLVSQVEQLKEEKGRLEAEQVVARESSSAAEAEVQRLKEKNTQLGAQVEGLQHQSATVVSNGPSQEEVEEMKIQIEEERNVVAKMEADHSSEVMGLKVQYEAQLTSVKEELAQVRREGEAAQSATEERLASEAAKKQELQSELESLKTAKQNGPIDAEQVDGGSRLEEELRAKEEELTKVEGERDNLKQRLKTTETKLGELQGKNTSLRDNCWQARDDSAQQLIEAESKLKQVYRDSEARAKEAAARVAEEMEEGEKARLQRLFTDVGVTETTSFSSWADEFETQAQLSIENKNKQVCELKVRVQELEENEHTYIREAQGFRDTLNSTLGHLATLQSQVNGESLQHQHLIKEREEMLQRERVTNRDLQQQLSRERETTANLEAKFKKVGEERVQELEGQLKDAVEEKGDLRGQVDRLTVSLEEVTLNKTEAEESITQLKAKCEELEARITVNFQQQQQQEMVEPTQTLVTVEFDSEKLGQSIISSDSTEV